MHFLNEEMETYFQRYVVAGGVMMFFLIPCSLFAIAYIVQGFINLRRGRLLPSHLLNLATNIKSAEELVTLKEALQNSDSLLSRIIHRLLHLLAEKTPPAETLEDIIADETSRLYQRNSQLAVIYTVAPLLGLLGTILGMMRAFYLFSTMNNPSVAQLSQGINEALVTTMWGLFIAIPSFVVLSLFRYRLFRYEREILPAVVEKIMANLNEFAKREEAQ